MLINMIAAMASNRIVGKDNKLPRHYSADLQHFKKITTGQIVVMGYNTFLSLGKPLPNRRNIILAQVPVEGMEWYESIEAMIKQLTSENIDQIFIIGGASIYRQFIPMADFIYLTEIKKAYEWDTSFPAFEEGFTEVVREVNDEMDFVLYKKK
ncbi:MAG: dihydrofolate reductase [uncultured bacterium (gcode 4)]|uniref:dihydrofolate reductase n=1 Tax=uncultured bacterium (gcode 4) TaxID=1234023 RepID=K1X4P9_9BACT|nr:MAG: dihydrofolate reductase [uncultured bacterium (gcode 4)]